MGRKLYVGNLAQNVTEDLLFQVFSQAGLVESARIIVDKDTQKSKGYAFIEMANDDEAGQAIEMINGQECEGKTLAVSEARPQQTRESRPSRNPPRQASNPVPNKDQ